MVLLLLVVLDIASLLPLEVLLFLQEQLQRSVGSKQPSRLPVVSVGALAELPLIPTGCTPYSWLESALLEFLAEQLLLSELF